MSFKRAQGRPVRGADDVGRDKLLEGARAFLRNKLEVNVSRQEIARIAGVTPALVSYYFPKKSDLIEAATRPILESYVGRLNMILGSERDHVDLLREVIVLFIDFNVNDANILQVFLHNLETFSRDGDAFIMDAFGELVDFFRVGAEAKAWRTVEPIFVLFAVWGMCKMVAEVPMIPVSMFADKSSGDETRRRQANLVVELLVNGIQLPKALDLDPPPS